MRLTNKNKQGVNMNIEISFIEQVKLFDRELNKRINCNLSLIKEYNNQLKNEDKTEKEIELISKSIQLIEREQTFIIGLLGKVYK